jgi:hypothetical protein
MRLEMLVMVLSNQLGMLIIGLSTKVPFPTSQAQVVSICALSLDLRLA